MAQSIPSVTRPGPGATFTLPLASPAFTQSPIATPTSTLNSPPSSSTKLKRTSYEYGSQYGPSPSLEDSDSRNEKHNELAESLKRSVTIVFWYKAKTQPLRLRVDIPTFPLLRLSEVEPIVATFNLSANSYVDVYNPQAHTWEQEQLCAVRSIESQQRVLYRMRRDLINGLEDDECSGLDSELCLQEESPPSLSLLYQPLDMSQKKRGSDEVLSPPSSKHHRSLSPQSASSAYTTGSALTFEDVNTPTFARHGVPDSGTQIDPSQPPMYATTFNIPSLQATSVTSGQASIDYCYAPQTPISPIQHARSTHNSNSGSSNTAMHMRANGSVPISSESSLAMAVTPPTPTLSIQPSPISPARPAYARLPFSQAAVTNHPTPSPTPLSTPLPSPATLPTPNQDHEPTSSPNALGKNDTDTGSIAGSPSSRSPGGNNSSTSNANSPSGGLTKAWPAGRYVCDITAGLVEMEAQMHREPALTQRAAFERVFHAAYKKSTFCNHRRVWKQAPRAALEEWQAAGRMEGALWSEFVRALEGKDARRLLGAVAQSQQAFGSPQGGVVHLGLGLGSPLGMRMQQLPQALSGMRREEPMGSLRPPEARGFLGEWFGAHPAGYAD